VSKFFVALCVTWLGFSSHADAQIANASPGIVSNVPAAASAATAAPTSVRPAVVDQIVAAKMACSELRNLDITAIGGAGSMIKTATESAENDTPTCIVEGMLAPSIGFRVSLPVESWRLRYLQIGCNSNCGNIPTHVAAAAGCVPLRDNGFVIGATDMGRIDTRTMSGKDPQQQRDFADRSVHLTADVAKALIRVFYGESQHYAYFDGCSDGGREGLIEAQRYPKDFDGVIAGAAAMNFQVQNALEDWQAATNTGSDGKAILTADDLPLLHQAVIDQCDGQDGLKDGAIIDPRACHFDPSTLQCPSPQAGTTIEPGRCLTAAQVQVIRKLYDGPRDPKTGQRLSVGGPQLGSELAWQGMLAPTHSVANLGFDIATFDKLRALHPLYDATNPDLKAFAAHGGKLVLWHGWADPRISPLNTIAYHEALQRYMGKARTADFERLYMLPGVYHCSGGEEPDRVDFLSAIVAWVEQGQAPDEIVAGDARTGTAGTDDSGEPVADMVMVGSDGPATDQGSDRPQQGGHGGGGGGGGGGHQRGMRGAGDASGKNASDGPRHHIRVAAMTSGPARTRPIYPYPFIAVYGGSGDASRAENYTKHAALYDGKTLDWIGSDFYQPYPPYSSKSPAAALRGSTARSTP